ncbi:hypothetical protein HX777_10095 [Pseudomonas agarici]|nr:hypothetical protein [Pseudomonas agarici]
MWMLTKVLASMILLAGIIVSTGCGPGSRQRSEADFSKGKKITYIVTTGPGGGYDVYGRMTGGFMQKYIGADHVVIRNVPGAGHIVGTNTLWQSKPDGLTIGTFDTGLIYGQIIGRKAQEFDLKKFEWIGKASSDARAIVVSKTCDIKTVDDLLNAKKPVKFAVAGIGSASYVDLKLAAEALNLNIEPIAGYNGTEGEMSMMRGDTCATLGSASSMADFVSAGSASYLLTIGDKMEGVADAMDYAKTDEAKHIISMISSMAQLGRVTAAPPGTSPERVAALRAAYKKSLEDPGLLAYAKKMNLPIKPAYGNDVKALVTAALDQTPETAAIIARAVEAK